MSNETNEIVTIAGKRVRVAHRKPGEGCCEQCCFGGDGHCSALANTDEWPCEKFDVETAYFVPAEEPPATIAEADDATARIPFDLVREIKTGRKFLAEYSSEAAEWYEKGTGKAYSIDEIEVLESYVPQTDVPAEESDADKAAEEAARAYGHKADKDGIGGDDYEDDIEIAFKAGIAWERERMMKEAEVLEGIVCGRVADHINIKVEGGDYLTPKGVMHILADKSKYEIGDKVKLIILK